MKIDKKIVVSFTSTGNRLKYLSETLKSLQNQSVPADAIELNIPHAYRRKDLDIPDLSLIPEGLSLFRCEDYGPATKVIPTLERYRGSDVVIIFCDDDRLYNETFIQRLIERHIEYPGCCIAEEIGDVKSTLRLCRWGRKNFIYRLKRVASLGKWKPSRPDEDNPNIFLGYGGVLVTPDLFDPSVKDIPDEFFFADDIWLSAKLAERNVRIVRTGRAKEEQSRPVLVDNEDLGRKDSSLAITTFDSLDRWGIYHRAIHYAINKMGIWGEWKDYL